MLSAEQIRIELQKNLNSENMNGTFFGEVHPKLAAPTGQAPTP